MSGELRSGHRCAEPIRTERCCSKWAVEPRGGGLERYNFAAGVPGELRDGCVDDGSSNDYGVDLCRFQLRGGLEQCQPDDRQAGDVDRPRREPNIHHSNPDLDADRGSERGFERIADGHGDAFPQLPQERSSLAKQEPIFNAICKETSQ